MTKEELLEKANSLPLAPGVYLMHDKEGTVIYVGKAKRLKNRVSQYFQAGRGHNLKTQTMVKLVDTFDTIVVGSEFAIQRNPVLKNKQTNKQKRPNSRKPMASYMRLKSILS